MAKTIEIPSKMLSKIAFFVTTRTIFAKKYTKNKTSSESKIQDKIFQKSNCFLFIPKRLAIFNFFVCIKKYNIQIIVAKFLISTI